MTTRRAALVVVAGLVLGTLVGLLLGPRSLTLAPTATGDPALAADFRAVLRTDRGLGPVVVARLRDGQVSYAGLAPAGTAAPTPQTPFELGSITKTMTGLLLADALRRGEMRLDAPVADYLPELAGTPAGAATLVQLATHASGLPETPPGLVPSTLRATWTGANPYDVSVERLLRLARETPVEDPGRYAYSNLGMSLLGHAEARAAGRRDWATLARERVLSPLGMTSTTFVTAAEQIPAGTVPGSTENGRPAPHWWGAGFVPAGSSTFTTAEDVMRFAGAVLQGRAPGTSALEPRADTSTGRVGLAWFTSERDGASLTWHNGATGGYRSMLALDRETGQAVLVLNSSSRWVDRPGLQLAAAAPGTDLQATDRPAATATVLGLAAAGLALLLGGVVGLVATARHRTALAGAALNATAGLVVLLGHGPWALVPAQAWSALAGVVLSALLVGALRARALPALPTRRPALAVSSAVLSALVLGLLVWLP